LACSAPKSFFGPIDGQLLGLVDIFTTAVPTLARIAFGILVGEHAALNLHHGRAGEILAGDQLDVLELAGTFVADDVGDLRINGGE